MVLAQLNKRMLLKNVTVRYAAMQYAHLNPETGVMRVASAGMHGLFHLRIGAATIWRCVEFRWDFFRTRNTR